MRSILFFILGAVIVGSWSHLEYHLGYLISKAETIPGDYHETSAFAHLKENKCLASGNYFDGLEVQVVFTEMDGAVGRWTPSERKIELSPKGGMDVDTVAHEVFHMVEDVMRWYQIPDPHYGAYLQGNWTACVWKLVENEQEKDKPKFRFLSN